MGQPHSNLRQRCQRPVPGVLHSTRSNTYRESGSPRSILDLWLLSRHSERSASNHHPQRLGHWDWPARARIFRVDLAFSPKRMSARPPLGLCTCRDPISQTIRVAEPREGRSQVQRCHDFQPVPSILIEMVVVGKLLSDGHRSRRREIEHGGTCLANTFDPAAYPRGPSFCWGAETVSSPA